LLWAGALPAVRAHLSSARDDAVESIRLAGAMRANCLVIYSGAELAHGIIMRRLLVSACLNGARGGEQKGGWRWSLEPIIEVCLRLTF